MNIQQQPSWLQVYTQNHTKWGKIIRQRQGSPYFNLEAANTNLSLNGVTMDVIANHCVSCLSAYAYFKINDAGYKFNIRQLTNV